MTPPTQPRLCRAASRRRSERLRERRHHDVPGEHARRRRPWHLRPRREGDLRPGSRCGGSPDGQQREQPAAVRGQDHSNPDRGSLRPTSRSRSSASRLADGAAIKAADGGTITVTAANIANPGFLALASFSSAGPRSGDSGAQASGHRPRREHRVGRHGHGQRADHRVRHVDGDAAHGRNRPAREAGASGLAQGRQLERRDRQHGGPEPRRGVQHARRRLRPDPGVERDAHAGDRARQITTPRRSTSGSIRQQDFHGSQHITLHNWGSTPVTFNVADGADQGSRTRPPSTRRA